MYYDWNLSPDFYTYSQGMIWSMYEIYKLFYSNLIWTVEYDG